MRVDFPENGHVGDFNDRFKFVKDNANTLINIRGQVGGVGKIQQFNSGLLNFDSQHIINSILPPVTTKKPIWM